MSQAKFVYLRWLNKADVKKQGNLCVNNSLVILNLFLKTSTYRNINSQQKDFTKDGKWRGLSRIGDGTG